MKDIYQRYRDGQFEVTVQDDEDAYFYALKDGDNLFRALKIKVHKVDNKGKKTYIGSYYKQWEEETSSNSINKFIACFLEDAEFRKEFHGDGEHWDGTIAFTNKSGVNKKCAQAIERFNNIKHKKFKDYAELKTFGMDKFSRMKIKDLEPLVIDEELGIIKQSFVDDKNVASVLKWIGRGLFIQDAVRKVKADLEIAANTKR